MSPLSFGVAGFGALGQGAPLGSQTGAVGPFDWFMALGGDLASGGGEASLPFDSLPDKPAALFALPLGEGTEGVPQTITDGLLDENGEKPRTTLLADDDTAAQSNAAVIAAALIAPPPPQPAAAVDVTGNSGVSAKPTAAALPFGARPNSHALKVVSAAPTPEAGVIAEIPNQPAGTPPESTRGFRWQIGELNQSLRAALRQVATPVAAEGSTTPITTTPKPPIADSANPRLPIYNIKPNPDAATAKPTLPQAPIHRLATISADPQSNATVKQNTPVVVQPTPTGPASTTPPATAVAETAPIESTLPAERPVQARPAIVLSTSAQSPPLPPASAPITVRQSDAKPAVKSAPESPTVTTDTALKNNGFTGQVSTDTQGKPGGGESHNQGKPGDHAAWKNAAKVAAEPAAGPAGHNEPQAASTAADPSIFISPAEPVVEPSSRAASLIRQIDRVTEIMANRIDGSIRAGQDTVEADLRLRPADLGGVRIILSVQNDSTVQARFIAERPETVQLLQQRVHLLQEGLSRQGLVVDKIQVSIQPAVAAGGAQGHADPSFGNLGDQGPRRWDAAQQQQQRRHDAQQQARHQYRPEEHS
jgi:flagellar hook-length control protein FliK